MRMAKQTPVSKWLTNRFLDWQRDQGELKSVSEFAEFLGVSQSVASKWLNGVQPPKGLYVERLAEKLGIEIYDVLGLERPATPRPDPQVAEMMTLYNQAPKKESLLEWLRLFSQMSVEQREKEIVRLKEAKESDGPDENRVRSAKGAKARAKA